ncbi:hypothetical protein BD311DRAFT_757899 [Dichomitus squalens]|uniref:Uncharacterized protein n=1 Tax=Dichomitus squalens TaxID=114155 RepID=A0A4Q9MRF0_9APHY|nr:hypothetical protein BD311DRAFT_757899 [Dichomitus squalens]
MWILSYYYCISAARRRTAILLMLSRPLRSLTLTIMINIFDFSWKDPAVQTL